VFAVPSRLNSSALPVISSMREIRQKPGREKSGFPVASLRLTMKVTSNKSGKLQVDTSILGVVPSCTWLTTATSFVPIIHRPWAVETGRLWPLILHTVSM
jgi:hypothetical protein